MTLSHPTFAVLVLLGVIAGGVIWLGVDGWNIHLVVQQANLLLP